MYEVLLIRRESIDTHFTLLWTDAFMIVLGPERND